MCAAVLLISGMGRGGGFQSTSGHSLNLHGSHWPLGCSHRILAILGDCQPIIGGDGMFVSSWTRAVLLGGLYLALVSLLSICVVNFRPLTK